MSCAKSISMRRSRLQSELLHQRTARRRSRTRAGPSRPQRCRAIPGDRLCPVFRCAISSFGQLELRRLCERRSAIERQEFLRGRSAEYVSLRSGGASGGADGHPRRIPDALSAPL